MASSSPARRSRNYVPSSPLPEILYLERNSEARHKATLEAARREHERVQQEAIWALDDHLKEQEHLHILEQERKAEERIRKDRELAAERRRLQALQAQRVDIPPEPKPKPKPAPATTPQASTGPSKQPAATASQTPAAPSAQPTPVTSQASAVPLTQPAPPASSSPFAQAIANKPAPQQQPNIAHTANTHLAAQAQFAAPQQQASSPFAPAAQGAAATAPSPFATHPTQAPTTQPNGVSRSQASSAAASGAPRTNQAPPDRYEVIHRNLKDLRRMMLDDAKKNPALKSRLGDMRREIRKCVGQLTNGGIGSSAQGNKSQVEHPTTPDDELKYPQIVAVGTLLSEALRNQVQSQLVDPSTIVLEPREPAAGALNNGEVPSLFLYLLNIFAKAAINQFISESGPKPETADPVGVVVASVFSDPRFLWRNRSLIDILLAKYRVVCPVLFGHTGNEKYEDGRRRLGWHKEGGDWVPEQQHFDRMTGLGAGFASISLRNFGKSLKKNPFPPSNYWTALAKIVNTPAADVSNTQAIVLKAMIQHYEAKFLHAYGTAGRDALRLALVDFPGKCPTRTPATESLQVLAQLLLKNTGLRLA